MKTILSRPLAWLVLSGAVVSTLAVASSDAKTNANAATLETATLTKAATLRVPPVLPPPEPPLVLPTWNVADAGLTDETRDEIQHDAFTYARRANADQSRALLGALTKQDVTCGRGHAAALAGMLSAGIDPGVVTDALGAMSSSCDETFVEAVGFVPNPDAAIASSLGALTEVKGREPIRRAAWLAYGSVAETARRNANGASFAAAIDAKIVPALTTSTGPERLLMVRAAGNSGCESCAPILAKDAASSNLELRRAAIAAHRFISTPSAVAKMCGALERETDTTTRDLAAWSLEHRTSSPAERARCLTGAALRDRDRGVRLQAVRTLGILSDDSREAHAALEAMSGYRGDVGTLANKILATGEPGRPDANDDSISLLQN